MKKIKIIRKGADLRILDFLIDLHNNLNEQNFIGLNETATKHKIGTCYGPTIKSLKIIKRIGFKKYLWLVGKPTLLMAKKILKHYAENRVKNLVKDEQIKINFIKQTENKTQLQVRTGIHLRYKEFLNELYNKIQNDDYIRFNDLCSKYKVGSQLGVILKNLKIIERTTYKKYIWIGKTPSEQMVNVIIEEGKLYYAKKVNNKNKEILQTKADFKKQAPEKSSLTKIKELKEQKQNYSLSLFWGLIKIKKS